MSVIVDDVVHDKFGNFVRWLSEVKEISSDLTFLKDVDISMLRGKMALLCTLLTSGHGMFSSMETTDGSCLADFYNRKSKKLFADDAGKRDMEMARLQLQTFKIAKAVAENPGMTREEIKDLAEKNTEKLDLSDEVVDKFYNYLDLFVGYGLEGAKIFDDQ